MATARRQKAISRLIASRMRVPALRRPTLFIGSSKESLPVVRTITERLVGTAAVTPWTDGDAFRRPGDYFLDSLLKAAAGFDLAVLVFGRDDLITSRGRTQPSPRDNVIFELGLFMATLARERTIIVAPRVWRTGLKILSDLAGLNLAEYDPPRRREQLTAALLPVIDFIKSEVQRLGVRSRQRGPLGVVMLWPELEAFAKQKISPKRKIDNIALDMEVTWRYLHDHILTDPQQTNVTWRSLLIDHRSPRLRKLCSATVSVETALVREQQIRRFCREHSKELARRKISFQCKAYDDTPCVHGFLVDDARLFVSLCAFKNGQLVGAPNPYLYLERPSSAVKDPGGAHLFDVFGGWFEFLWNRSRPVWVP